MFNQQQKMQDAFYDQYEMDLAFQLMTFQGVDQIPEIVHLNRAL